MKFSKNIKIFSAIYAFLAFGTIITSLTHQPRVEDYLALVNSSQEKILVALPFNSQDHLAYIEQVRPIIGSVGQSPSLAEVKNTQEELFNFKSQDASVGKIHVNLYLAFVDLENYFLTQDQDKKDQAISKLNLVADYLPELQPDIDNLTKIFEQWANT